MTYEIDPRVKKGGSHFERPELREEMVRGRWKNTCEDMPPGTLCYGFVFEEDPNGPDLGRKRKAQPQPGQIIDVVFTDQLDLELPGQIGAATIQQLQRMRKEFYFDELRAPGDPWIGPAEEWRKRREMVERELLRRGAALEPLERMR